MSKENSKKILVTGGSGYVGSVLVPMLLEKGYKVNVLDNLMFHQQSLVSSFINKNFKLTKGDVRDKDILKDLLKDADFIIHLAALVGEPACDKDPDLCTSLNTGATELISDLRSKDQPLIFASTGSVYGKIGDLCTEESPANPLSKYGISKLKAEEAVKQKENHIIYRYATAFGLSPRLRLDLLINDFAYKASKNDPLVLYEHHFKRTFIHVVDIARSLVHAIENFDSMKDETYNVGSGDMNFTKKEIVEKIKEKSDFYVHLADFGSDPDQRNYEVSYDKINSKGFKTTIDIDQGIDELLKGYETIHIPNPHSNVGYRS